MDLIFSDCHLLCNVYFCIECREQKRKKMFINMCALSVGRRSFGDMCALRKFARLFLYSLTTPSHSECGTGELLWNKNLFSSALLSRGKKTLGHLCVVAKLGPAFSSTSFFYNPFKYSNTFKATESTIPSRVAGRIFTFSKGKKISINIISIFLSQVNWFWDFSFWIKGQRTLQRATCAVCTDTLKAL